MTEFSVGFQICICDVAADAKGITKEESSTTNTDKAKRLRMAGAPREEKFIGEQYAASKQRVNIFAYFCTHQTTSKFQRPLRRYNCSMSENATTTASADPRTSGSPEQKAIWEEIEHGYTHLIVEARAGTGKTFTL
jgi:hypothetical protein